LTAIGHPEAIASRSTPGRRGVGTASDSLTYGEHLQLAALLDLQAPVSGEHDETFFIVVHQIYELWFKAILHELTSARDLLLGDTAGEAIARLRRVVTIERTLVQQVDAIETIRPARFVPIRERLGSASALPSALFREIEVLSGLKEPGYLEIRGLTDPERERLRRRLGEPSLWDAFVRLLERRGAPDPGVILRADGDSELYRLSEALLEHDEWFSLWRARHVHMVERIIGRKPGTGGSSGVEYLQSTLRKRFFPRLWEIRAEL
jgi:tryptophan 2,3-dioxygenase